MNSKGKITENLDTATGVLRAFFDSEIAAGCTRLGIRSRKDLLIEADGYPSTEDEPEAYQATPAPCLARARAVELLSYLAFLSQDGVSEPLEWVDECIAELRKVLKTAATEIPGLVALRLKRAA
jgi:hypothetical protein